MYFETFHRFHNPRLAANVRAAHRSTLGVSDAELQIVSKVEERHDP